MLVLNFRVSGARNNSNLAEVSAILVTSFLPGEYFGSFVRRNKELQCDVKLSRSEYLARRFEFRTKPGFNPLPERYSDRHGESEVLNMTTLYPLAEKFGVEKISYTTITPSESWKICAKCVFEDISETGVAYIHRQHVIPGVKCCYRHAEILLSACPACRVDVRSHRISSFYGCIKSCGFGSAKGPLAAGDFEFSRFASDLLISAVGALNNRAVKRAIELELSSLDYGDVGRIDFEQVSADIAELLKLGRFRNGRDFHFSRFPDYRFYPLLKLSYFAFRKSETYLSAVATASTALLNNAELG